MLYTDSSSTSLSASKLSLALWECITLRLFDVRDLLSSCCAGFEVHRCVWWSLFGPSLYIVWNMCGLTMRAQNLAKSLDWMLHSSWKFEGSDWKVWLHRLNDASPLGFNLIDVILQVAIPVKMGDKVLQAEDVLTHLVAELGRSHVHYGQSDLEFDLSLELEHLSEIQINALGMTGVKAIYMHVKLPSMQCGASVDQQKPTIDFGIYKMPYCDKEATYFQQHKLHYRLKQICEAFFSGRWPSQNSQNGSDSSDFLVCLYKHIRDRIPQLGNFCVVCGCQQEHPGLKPVPCNSKACNHAFDELGIGADLSLIDSSPVVADLLISMASAASRCTDIARRKNIFKPVPSNLIHSIHTGCFPLSYGSVNWRRMHKAFAGIPSQEILSKKPNFQELLLNKNMGPKERRRGLIRFKLLRSVLSSFRGHLIQLQGADRFAVMETENQFRLCTDSPAKEAAFTRLKEKHGSQFLFHGSPFSNWHSILREGLKNMSGTRMMSHGDTEGSGIYLANWSTTSAAYCYSKLSDTNFPGCSSRNVGWYQPKCLALCEVIKNSGGQFQVVPDPDRVITRYLFAYVCQDIPRVLASSLESICEKHAKPQTGFLTTVQEAI